MTLLLLSIVAIFYRLIDAIESREVRLLNPKELHDIVQDIDRLNQRKKSKS